LTIYGYLIDYLYDIYGSSRFNQRISLRDIPWISFQAEVLKLGTRNEELEREKEDHIDRAFHRTFMWVYGYVMGYIWDI